MSDTKKISQTDMKAKILELMINTISDDKTGEVPPQFREAFVEFQLDNEGIPYLQTLAGIVTVTKDKTELVYSANYGYTAEQVSVETANLSRLALLNGWEFVVSLGHFITPDGQFFSGANAYNAWRALEQNMIINTIKERVKQRQEDQGPQLILPDQKIIKPH